jgi:hypothetical protein
MKRKLLLICYSIFCIATHSYAQIMSKIVGFSHAKGDSVRTKKEYRNTVRLSMANFSILGITKFNLNMGPPPYWDYIANQFGLNYEHKIDNCISVAIGYSEWNINSSRSDSHPTAYTSFLYSRRYIKGSRNIDDIGALRHRYGYKMIDAAASYRYDKFRRHKFTGGAGISYTWGTNYYLTHRFFSAYENDYVYYTRKESEGYAGAIIPVRYDFLFLRNRFATGVQGTARKYFGLQSWQIDYGIHLGVNF